MYIKRNLETIIEKFIDSPEIIAITGVRQSGKTTLMQHIAAKLEKSFYFSFEDIEAKDLFDNSVNLFIEMYIEPYDYIFIDEFQYSHNGGKNLKFIYDYYKAKGIQKKIFISGSAILELTVNTIKYLVGRIFSFTLYPLSFDEYIAYKDLNLYSIIFEKDLLTDGIVPEGLQNKIKPYFDEFLLYGGYPRVVVSESNEEKIVVLKNIYNTYLLRDVKDIINIKDDYKIHLILKALALQIGNIISYNELSRTTGINFEKLKQYLNLLEKTFVIKFITPFFTNKRKELVKNPKVYFIDLGLRNSLLNDFRLRDLRVDAGAVLENYHCTELLKNDKNPKFWRTKSGAEVDFILEENGNLIPIEIKSNLKLSSGKIVLTASLKSFIKKYEPSRVVVYNNDKMLEQDSIVALPHFYNRRVL